MSRTVTKNEQCIAPRGEDSLSFFKLENSPKALYPIRAYIPPGSVLDVPPHFHLTHDEIFTIEQGELDITQNGVAKRYDPSSGEITIPRGTIHSIHAIAPADAPIITWERTDPGDQQKEFIFRVLNSVLLDSSVCRKTGNPCLSDAMQINLTCYNFDGYFALLPRLGIRVNLLIDGALAWVASLAGYKLAYPEYITNELWEAVVKGRKEL